MPTYLEKQIEIIDPEGKIREEQHLWLEKALAPVTDSEVLKVMCLLSEASNLIMQCTRTSDQAMCTEMLHNMVLNIENFTDPAVAAMFTRNLYGTTQH